MIPLGLILGLWVSYKPVPVSSHRSGAEPGRSEVSSAGPCPYLSGHAPPPLLQSLLPDSLAQSLP